MSNSFDMDGWELFNTPFSSTVKTAPPRQQAGRPQQPLEATQHNTTPTAAQRNSPSASAQKAQQPVRQTATQQKTPAVKQPNLTSVAPVPASDKKPAPSTPTPVQAASPKAPANTQPAEPQKELTLDMSSGSGTASVEDDTAKRKAHEEAEAKRKAEWEAKQAAKKQAEEATLQKLQNMSDDDVIAASVERVGAEVERITHRNMKECVAEHIQELARKDPDFARKIMNPLAHKSMINCFRFINRKAKDFIQKMMEDNDLRPDRNGMFGESVPDNIVYQWSEDYINSTDAPEDKIEEEKFIPKPYVGTPSKPASKPKKTTTKAKKTEKTAAKNQEPKDDFEQMSLFQEGRC